MCLFWAIQQFGVENVHALTFDYHQRHHAELTAAVQVAHLAGVETRHEVLEIGPILAGTSPLTDPGQQLELYESPEEMAKIIGHRVEKTFVPLRNALFLTLAANRAAVLGCQYIVTGVCQEDNANYPDCRSVFIDAQEEAINQALGHSFEEGPWIEIKTPLMEMSKAESVLYSYQFDGAYRALAFSHTAYDGQYPPVGKDHASVLRADGFHKAGVPDPLVVRAHDDGLMELPSTSNYTSPNGKKQIGGLREWLPIARLALHAAGVL